jgi:predicted ATPase
MRWHHATIALAPLDRTQVRDMVAELSARYALPCEVADNVAARIGGVPLSAAPEESVGERCDYCERCYVSA